MNMLRSVLLFLTLVGAPLLAQPNQPGELAGRIEGKNYVSPTGAFRVIVPVLPELGGRVNDTNNVVTFQDDFNVLATIAAFPMDATQRWELSTRGQKDYLAYFFANYVMPDFQQSFPGASAESAKYASAIGDGSLIVYTLLPGGSMFAHKLSFAADQAVLVAKRGNLVFVRNGWVFVLSVELAERILERSSYHQTTAEEDDVLRQRLVDLFGKIEFTKPAATPTR
jgi:hypothetical protein